MRAAVQKPIHLKSAIIIFPNDPEAEPMTSDTKDMKLDPIPLDTKTMSNANISPLYLAGENRLLESNPCASD